MPSASSKRMNTLRLDPTRTTMLRRRFVAEMKRRFDAFRRALLDLVVREDAFGLARKGWIVVQQRYVALTTPQQLEEFRRWVQEQTGRTLTDSNWLQRYIEEAYEKGQGRAFDDAMKKYGYGGRATPEYYRGSREQFLRDAFRRPASIERVSLLASRSYTDLKGVAEQLSTQLNRTMTDAIVQGRSPRDVGRELNKVVDGYRNRGLTIARTETIRAHADGQLESLKNLGVEEVGVMVEWSTAGDDLVCDLCAELDGAVFKIGEASGIIPRHPNCRCAWLPANVGEDAKGQKKGGEAQAAVDRSIAGEIPKGLRGRRPLEEQRGISRWPGADAKVGRPLDAVDVPPAMPPKPPAPVPPKPVKMGPTPKEVAAPGPDPSDVTLESVKQARKEYLNTKRRGLSSEGELKEKFDRLVGLYESKGRSFTKDVEALESMAKKAKTAAGREQLATVKKGAAEKRKDRMSAILDDDTKARLEKGGVNLKSLRIHGGISEEKAKEFLQMLADEVENIQRAFPKADMPKWKVRRGIKINVQNADKIWSGDSPVPAVYRPKDGSIHIAGKRPRKMSGGQVRWKDFSVGDTWADTTRHEIGHLFDYRIIGEKKRAAWEELAKKYVVKPGEMTLERNVVSEYGQSNARELFAESFAAYTNPTYREGTTRLPADIERFFQNLF